MVHLVVLKLSKSVFQNVQLGHFFSRQALLFSLAFICLQLLSFYLKCHALLEWFPFCWSGHMKWRNITEGKHKHKRVGFLAALTAITLDFCLACSFVALVLPLHQTLLSPINGLSNGIVPASISCNLQVHVADPCNQQYSLLYSLSQESVMSVFSLFFSQTVHHS